MEWMGSDHYHCPKCRAVITIIKRVPWVVMRGVQVIGICETCNKIFIEREYPDFLGRKTKTMSF